jgi:hypothetical protein
MSQGKSIGLVGCLPLDNSGLFLNNLKSINFPKFRKSTQSGKLLRALPELQGEEQAVKVSSFC